MTRTPEQIARDFVVKFYMKPFKTKSGAEEPDDQEVDMHIFLAGWNARGKADKKEIKVDFTDGCCYRWATSFLRAIRKLDHKKTKAISCCSNEVRNMDGGCDSCGDPCVRI